MARLTYLRPNVAYLWPVSRFTAHWIIFTAHIADLRPGNIRRKQDAWRTEKSALSTIEEVNAIVLG